MAELAYVNGKFCPIANAKVSIEDRGFQFGDGVYEVIVAYEGQVFLLAPHMKRLRRSAAAIGFDYDFDANPLEPIIEQGLKRCRLREATIYVQLTRGAGVRSHVIPDGLTPTVVMTFRRRPDVPDELRERGAKVMTTLDTRWINCYIKAITLLPNLLAKNEALQKGYDDAVFASPSGQVRECTAANLFVVYHGNLLIPTRTEYVLHGVTQAFAIECAELLGIRAEERGITIDMMCGADEVFMSGTTVEILGITEIDGQPVGDGQVGPITEQLYAEFLKRSRAGTSSASKTERVRS